MFTNLFLTVTIFIQLCIHIFLLCYKNFQNSFLKSSTPYTSKQLLMMAYEGSESARENVGKFIYQFQPETKTPIRKLERVLDKLYRHNLHIYIYIYMCVCVCVCGVCVCVCVCIYIYNLCICIYIIFGI